jgi:hypothetical protein
MITTASGIRISSKTVAVGLSISANLLCGAGAES